MKILRGKSIFLLSIIFFFLISSSCRSTLGTSSTKEEKDSSLVGLSLEDAEGNNKRADDVQTVLEKFKAMDKATMDIPARLIYAILLRTEEDYDESRQILEELLSENSSHASAWFNLALLEDLVGHKEARDHALEKALEIEVNNPEFLAFHASLAMQDSDWKEAEISYQKALNEDENLVEALLGLAWVMGKTKRLEKSLALLDKAVEIEPDYVYIRVDRSRVNLALSRYNAAEDDLDFAIEHDPHTAWHYLDRARIRLRYFQDYEGALEDLENVQRLDPDNFFAHVSLAHLHDEARRFRLAKNSYDRILAIRPDYIWAFLPLAKISWMMGEYQEALDFYQKAAQEEEEDNFTYPFMIAFTMRKLGKEKEAQKVLTDYLSTVKEKKSLYEVLRFCIQGGSDYYAINALNNEKDKTLRERLWFYMGLMYEREGNTISMQATYSRMSSLLGQMEYDIAWANLNGMEG